MEEKVLLTVAQMQELKSRGVDVVRYSVGPVYKIDKGFMYSIDYTDILWSEDIAAFTLQDCLDVLPKVLQTDLGVYTLVIYVAENRICYAPDDDVSPALKCTTGPDLLSAAYEMIIWQAGVKL